MTSRNDRNARADRAYYKAHWTIFLPAIVVAFLYGIVLILLLITGNGDTDLAKIMLLVLLMVVPLLLVRAYLRYASLGLRVGHDYVAYRQGWLRPRWKRLRLDEVSSAKVRHGLAGDILGGGDLVFTLYADRPVQLQDLARPGQAALEVMQRINGTNRKR